MSIILLSIMIFSNKFIKSDKSKGRYDKRITKLMLFVAVFYITATYVLGIYVGFYNSTVLLSKCTIINYIILYILIIIATENIRKTILLKENNSEDLKKYLILSIAMFVLGLLNLAMLLRYNSKTRSAEKMYEAELNKILFDYKSYVQKISTPLNYTKYEIIKLETFTELMQTREDVQAPILMYTEKNRLKTVFTMMKDDVLYIYIKFEIYQK